MPIELLLYLLVSEDELSALEHALVIVLVLKALDELVMLFEVLDELLLDLVHLVDL